jgi:NAD dependent epimerase/dehydratase family
MTILVTGVAGFIGFQLARKLLQKGQDVVGLDNVNDYYDVSLKEARLRELEEVQGFRFMRLVIAEGNGAPRQLILPRWVSPAKHPWRGGHDGLGPARHSRQGHLSRAFLANPGCELTICAEIFWKNAAQVFSVSKASWCLKEGTRRAEL